MIYLDYSATTPVDKEVLELFNKIITDYIGNANSLHKLGLESKQVMNKASSLINEILKTDYEVIYNSSASEANNLAIKGIVNSYSNRGKHIISTKLEHSSILETLNYLEKTGFEISYVKLKEDGSIDLDDLKKLIRKDTILVTVCHVNSEVGIIQDIDKINKIIKECNPLTFFHVDGTQAIGKVKVDVNDSDLYTFSAHKFYGLKGIAVLLKKKSINLTQIIHGGKSQTIYRSGTPTVALMASLSKALKNIHLNIDNNYNYVLSLNQYLLEQLNKNNKIIINNTEKSIPHIINISILNIKPETILHYLEQKEIYISTKTACSKNSDASFSLLALNKSKDIASTSIRISLSHLTTKEELDILITEINNAVKELSI